RIATESTPPSFANTIVPLETSGLRLDQIDAVFGALTGADTNDALQTIERDVAPLLARHLTAIRLNQPLFRRIHDLHAKGDALGLDAEERRVLERYHTNFVRAGAKLDAAGKRRLAEINERLATLGTLFSQNVLADEKSWTLVLERGEEDRRSDRDQETT